LPQFEQPGVDSGEIVVAVGPPVAVDDGGTDGVAGVGVAGVGVAEIGVAEIGVAEIGVAEVGVAEVGVAEVGVADDGDSGGGGGDSSRSVWAYFAWARCSLSRAAFVSRSSFRQHGFGTCRSGSSGSAS
jgi:hypothetical protein